MTITVPERTEPEPTEQPETEPAIETPETDRHILRETSGDGDTPVTWTPGNQAEEDAARAHFNMLKGKRYRAYRMDNGQREGDPVEDFDPTVGEYLMVRHVSGG